jgi:hypothetical protein
MPRNPLGPRVAIDGGMLVALITQIGPEQLW